MILPQRLEDSSLSVHRQRVARDGAAERLAGVGPATRSVHPATASTPSVPQIALKRRDAVDARPPPPRLSLIVLPSALVCMLPSRRVGVLVASGSPCCRGRPGAIWLNKAVDDRL
jgi:hypothetical protein